MEEISKPFRTGCHEWFLPEDYACILRSTNDVENVCHVPPAKPSPGEIYLFETKGDNNEDWRCDQYRWNNTGIKLLPKGKGLVRCSYFKCTDEPKFQRRAYMLLNDIESGRNGKLILIHYVGDCKVPVTNSAHGNCKNNPTPHCTTTKSQLKKQKLNLNTKPKETYRNLVNASDIHPVLAPVMDPKNSKQVKNSMYREKQKKQISNDDVLGLYIMNAELGGYIKNLSLLPNFLTILCSDGMLDLCKTIYTCGKEPVLYYDTTFNLGDFYVSTLILGNNLFEGDPVIPLAFCIHDRKTTDLHCSFFNTVKGIFPEVRNSLIVTDREEAIRKAIKMTLPENKNLCCWNHIQQDVKHWVKKQTSSDEGDIQIYMNNVWDLLDSTTLDEFNEKYSDMSIIWSSAFKDYFDNYLKDDVMETGKWNLLILGVYKERSGITINPSESMNAVLKRVAQRQEMKCQTLTLTLYQLDLFYQKEILRGLSGVGDYKLKPELVAECKIDLKDVAFPKGLIPLDKIPYVFENKDFEKHTSTVEQEEPFSLFGIAKMMVLQGKVRHVPEEQSFIVNSGNQRHIVSIFPKEICSCMAKRKCVHILAVKLSIGNFEKPKSKVKLNTLMRRKRGYKAGRKGGPRKVIDVGVADDSLYKNDADDPWTWDMESPMCIPTKTSGSKIIKRRLIKRSAKSNALCDTLDLSKEDDGSGLFKELKNNIPNAYSTPLINKENAAGHKDEALTVIDEEVADDPLNINDDADPCTMDMESPVCIATKKSGCKIIKRRLMNVSDKSNVISKKLDFCNEDGGSGLIKEMKNETPNAHSTPFQEKVNADNEFALLISSDDDDDDFNSIAHDTFDDKFKANKPFTIFGYPLYPSALECLTTNEYSYNRYMSDSVIPVYMSIVEDQLKNKNNVTTQVCEAMLSFSQVDEQIYQYAFRLVVRSRIPECDVVLIPIVEHSHCTLFVIIRKKRIIIYLDSLHMEPKKKYLKRIKTLYTLYSEYSGQEFEDFKIYAPTDIPKQRNGFDCGLYVCMFSDIILKKTEDPTKHHLNETIEQYRNEIYETVVNFLKRNPFTKPKNKKHVSRNKIKQMKLTNTVPCEYNVCRESPGPEGTIQFMANLIDNYWDETSTTCFQATCKKPTGTMVLCNKCNHWFHLECIGLNNEKLPKIYLCPTCIEL